MKTFIYVILFLIFMAPVAIAAESKTNAVSLPVCTRPMDMSLPVPVLKYAECLNKKRQLCNKHERHKECVEFRKTEHPKAVSSTIAADALPSERCAIQRDGSYKCRQDALRFVIKETPKTTQPTATPIKNSTEEKSEATEGAAAPTTNTDTTSPTSDMAPPPIAPPANIPR